MLKESRGAFTLIELLIVVLIIAILAAIAVPNFLEFQVRAKVSRAMSDMRSLVIAIEAYTVDDGRPPIGGNEGNRLNLWNENTRHYCFNRFTSPIAYISSVGHDPFAEKVLIRNPNQNNNVKILPHYTYQYLGYDGAGAAFRDAHRAGYNWYLRSVGPDHIVSQPYFSQMVLSMDTANANMGNIYDPTNGTNSKGDIYLSNYGFLKGR